MPFAYKIDPGRGLTTAMFYGIVSTDDFYQYVSTMTSDSDWCPGFDQLVDLSSVKRIRIDYEGTVDQATFAHAYRSAIGNGRLAVVAPTDYAFAASRSYVGMTGDLPRTAAVFRYLHLAERWLAQSTEDSALIDAREPGPAAVESVSGGLESCAAA